jgi:hypothetical protein
VRSDPHLKKQARLYHPALAQPGEAAPPVEEPDEPRREEQLEERVCCATSASALSTRC